LLAPFVEKEDGIGIASGALKVENEDLANPGSLRGDRARG